jgi:hypothetical protein
MNRLALLFVITATSIFTCTPSAAQLGTDPAAVGAMTYCASRDQGLDNAQAAKRAYGSLASVMDIATFLVHKQNIDARMLYMAKQQCPQYF